MLDEMFQRNASKFDIFLEYENPHASFSLGEKNKVAQSENRKKHVSFHIPTQIFRRQFTKLYFFLIFEHCEVSKDLLFIYVANNISENLNQLLKELELMYVSK